MKVLPPQSARQLSTRAHHSPTRRSMSAAVTGSSGFACGSTLADIAHVGWKSSICMPEEEVQTRRIASRAPADVVIRERLFDMEMCVSLLLVFWVLRSSPGVIFLTFTSNQCASVAPNVESALHDPCRNSTIRALNHPPRINLPCPTSRFKKNSWPDSNFSCVLIQGSLAGQTTPSRGSKRPPPLYFDLQEVSSSMPALMPTQSSCSPRASWRLLLP